MNTFQFVVDAFLTGSIKGLTLKMLIMAGRETNVVLPATHALFLQHIMSALAAHFGDPSTSMRDPVKMAAILKEPTYEEFLALEQTILHAFVDKSRTPTLESVLRSCM